MGRAAFWIGREQGYAGKEKPSYPFATTSSHFTT
jgi:hypothetical protein